MILVLLSHLLKVLDMVFGGSKDHRLLLRLYHIPQQMKQQRWFIVNTNVKESELTEEKTN